MSTIEVGGLILGTPSIFQYHFMQNAFIAGTLVAIVAGVIGYFMVIRNQSFAGHSLANVGFAGATGAALFGIPALLRLFLAGVIAAIGIHYLGIGARHSQRSDVAIGAVFTASLALGFLFVHLSTTQSVNIYNVLFGNILGISDSDVTITWIAALCGLVLIMLALRPLLFASVDPLVAAARGVPVAWLGLGFLLVLAVVVAVAVQIVGVLLIFSLLVTPAATARRISPRPIVAIGLSIILAVICTWLGLIAGYYTSLPVSFFIATFAFIFYILVRSGYGSHLPRRATIDAPHH